jgi:phosphatidylglycerophosphate synthase
MLRQLTLADALTWCRIGAVPVLVVCAMTSEPTAFALVLLSALATDALDGPIARARGTVTAQSGALDSVADALLYVTAPLLALRVYPDLRHNLGSTMQVIVWSYAIPPAVGWLRFRRLPSYHTRLARLAGVSLGLAFTAYVTMSIRWPLSCAAAMLLVSAIEEIAITCVLSQWTHPVSSVHEAWQLTRTSQTPPTRGSAA